ncbi:hypothetical protein [Streptomyces sp. AK02-01A]|uniref:hypothetical protein n=1 Tax=Streptomyces sp. AK02-01A TaxID=3028648 RepID=UPI0029ACC3BE|nr:hypothetical protein [Streptomyces sp. AK02-01A]MDX3853522.1 hypothetical protein [Streptomyces sp. AK02-01A]
MTAGTWVTVAAVAVAVVTLALNGIWARKHHVKQTEQFYLARYWNIIDRFPKEAMVNGPSGELNDAQQHAVLLYLRLCEDEADLRSMCMVSDAVWQAWEKGIRSQLCHWPVAGQWQRISGGDLAVRNKGQFKHLRALMATDAYDPCQRNRPGRWRRGL